MLKKLLARRAELQAQIDAALEAVEKEERSELTAEEDTQVRAAREELVALDPRIAELVEDEKRAKAAEELAATAADLGARTTRAAVVTREERTYSAEAGQRENRSFIADVFAHSVRHDLGAAERLSRHAREFEVEERASTTANYAGFVIPQYLIDQFAYAVRAGRPTANAIGSMDLPPQGVSFHFGALTTPTTVSAQNGENTAGSNTNPDDTDNTFSVVTISGYADTSRQSVERAQGVAVDQLIVRDLVAAYHTELDRQVLNGSGASGELTGILNTASISAVDYLDASPTIAEFYSKLADAVQRINALRFAPAELIVMHPRRWGWLTAAADTNQRPLILPNASQGRFNSVATGAAAGYGQAVGEILGLPVVTDANVPTNLALDAATGEDAVIVAKASDYVLMEDPGAPLSITVDQVLANSLGIRFVVYGYAAFTAARYPKATSTVTGSGLTAPTF
jgi:HK97 family phage major capsid protein